FAEGPAAEVAQGDELRHPRVDGGQAIEGVVDRDHLVVAIGARNAIEIEGHPAPSAALGGRAASGVIDEDAAHRLGGGGEEVAAAIELLVPDQPQESLMNERGGVEGVALGPPPPGARRRASAI